MVVRQVHGSSYRADSFVTNETSLQNQKKAIYSNWS